MQVQFQELLKAHQGTFHLFRDVCAHLVISNITRDEKLNGMLRELDAQLAENEIRLKALRPVAKQLEEGEE